MRALFIVAMAVLQLTSFRTCSHYDSYREYVASNEAANTVFPKNYKSEILALLRTYFSSPTQVRDASISEPVIKKIDGAERYIVCMRYNAKQSDGKYAGSKELVATFRDGRLNHLIDTADPRDPRQNNEVREQCREVAQMPFVELQQLRR